MALPSNAHVTLAELKDYMPKSGEARDGFFERMIGRASAQIDGEGLGFRRAVYRGPVESYNNLVAAAAIANGSLTVLAAPNSAGRTIVVRKTDADRSLKAGILTITQATPALVETFDLSHGDELHGLKFFTNTVTAALTGVSGAGTGDTVEVGTSAGYTELYSPHGGQAEIVPLEWPVRNVAQVHESYDRLFDATTLLTVATDYELRNQGTIRRAIARVDGSSDIAWASGRRVVQARLSAGYKGPAEVHVKIKGVCLELAAWHAQHAEKDAYGLSSVSDALGNRSFSGPPMLTTGMKAELSEFRRAEFGPTAERAWQEEAA
jgi:hypothetical protein